MAGVSGRRDERGQLILIAAFALAVTFVALALVVNSAIYTENLAARGEGGATADALSERHAVEDELGDVVATLNVHNATTWSDLEEGLNAAVGNTSRIAGLQGASQGRYVNVSSIDAEPGTRIADVTPGGSTFEGANETDRWTVARTDATRAFVLHISRTSVTSSPETFGDSRSDEFEVNVTHSGDVWLLNVTDRGDVFTVGVSEPDGDSGVCTAPGSSATVAVDLSAGRVGGRECDALSFADDFASTYQIEFNNSALVTGNYSLVVDRDGYSNDELESGPTAGDPDDPYARVAIYAATVRYRYDAPTVHYETSVRVAPGEADG